MNILQILPQLNVGGVETGTVDLAKYLVKNGHGCVVISGGGELVRELENSGIRHYTLPVDSKAFWVMIKTARKVAQIIRQENIDIVHARSRVPAWIGFMATRSANAVLLTTAHGHYSKHIFSYMMGQGKYTIVPSSVIGKHMIEDFGVPFENIRLIPRSVDLERYSFKGLKERRGKKFVVGVIGRITPIKGQIYFLKAMAKILRSASEVTAVIVGGVSAGKDSYMEELEVWTRRLGLASFVTFMGNRRDIPQVLLGLDCLVMPSIAEESFGRVIVEAQASGVPVVATKVGGVVEIIDDQVNGLLVYPKDSDGLADAVLRIYQDESFARQLADNARKKVEEKFSLVKMAQDTIKVYEEAMASPRILVIKISAIGDAILAIPSFKAIKSKFPYSKVVCLVGMEAKDVFGRCPYIDELIVYDIKNKEKGWRGVYRLAKKLMRRRFDIVIDLQNNKKSHILSYATFSARRYGYDNGKFSFLLNHKIKDTPPGANRYGAGVQPSAAPVEHQFRVLKMLDIDYNNEALELWPSSEDNEFAEAFLDKTGSEKKLIGVNIGSSPRWQSKRWPYKRFSQLCGQLIAKGYRVLLTGNAYDAATAKKILKDMKAEPLCSVGRTSLMQLASLIKKCDCYVTGDSAPMHVAAAVGVPFVAFFGPTYSGRHLPLPSRSVVLQKGCVPCYKEECRKKEHECMEKITVQDCLAAIEELLRK